MAEEPDGRSGDDRVLERHFRHWRARGLVSAEQEAALREASVELARRRGSNVVRVALALLGGGLLLAGLVLVVAENWLAIPRSAKLVGWAALQAGFLLGAHDLGRRFPGRPALAEALAMVAGGWVLAGIALVSQIYHLDGRAASALWLWLALVLPAGWALPRRTAPVVVFVALIAALAAEVAEPDSLVRAQDVEGPWIWLGLPLLAAWLASWLPRHPAFLRGCLAAWVFAAANLFLLVLGGAQELDRSTLGRGWWVAGAGLALALTTPDRVFPRTWDAVTARASLALALLPWVLMGAAYDRGRVLDELAVGLSWVTQLALAVIAIRAGARANAAAGVNLGYVALLAGILTRYFDFFGDYLEGGIALAATGMLLLVVVFGLEKARRRTLARPEVGA